MEYKNEKQWLEIEKANSDPYGKCAGHNKKYKNEEATGWPPEWKGVINPALSLK